MSPDDGPGHMDRAAKTIYKPVYPFLARRILAGSEIRSGTCLDIGTGPASMAVSIARSSDLLVYAMDVSPGQARIAKRNIEEESMAGRVTVLTGDVHRLPFADESIDLAVSRGSVFFWGDLARAFSEIYRALKPGGMSYVGGGMGNARLKELVRRSAGPDGTGHGKRKMSTEELVNALDAAGIVTYTVVNDDSGLWAVIRKPG